MNLKFKRVAIAWVLVFCLVFSACGGVEIPSDMDEFLNVEDEVVITPAPQEEEDRLEDVSDFGVVSISETEDLLRVYYGITFEDNSVKTPNFQLVSKEYDFSSIVYGATINTADALSDGKVTVVATVAGYDFLGNSLSKGITSNMSSDARLSYFESDNYIHGLGLTYPGTYYVTYDVTVKESAQTIAGVEYPAQTLSYKVERTYIIEKVDAYITADTDFYFVKANGADEKATVDVVITTTDGWDITEVAAADVYATSKVTLSVPTTTVPTDTAAVFEVAVVGTMIEGEVEYSEISSKYFDLNFDIGYIYVVPAQEEISVAAVYNTLSSLAVDYYMDEYDYSKWDSYMAVLDDYNALSDTQKIMFDLYPSYLLKYVTSFSYTDYYNMRAAHDWLVCMEYDKARLPIATDFEKLLEQYQSGACDIDDLTDYLTNLSGESIFIEEILDYDQSNHDSDLEFVVKYTFDGKYQNGENGYVDLEISSSDCGFAASGMPINLSILQSESEFAMYVQSASVLWEILNGDSKAALLAGEEYYEYYLSYMQVAIADEYAEYIHNVIMQYMEIEYDEKFEEYNAYATVMLSGGNFISNEIEFALDILRECLKNSYSELLDFQATESNREKYVMAISSCEIFMLRLDCYFELLEIDGVLEYLEENGELETASGSVLCFDTESGNAIISGSNDMGYAIINCSILNIADVCDAFKLEISEIINEK